MALGAVVPFAKPQYFDDNGDPLAGGFLYTYVSGTSTALQTYSDANLTTPNTNPIVLDAAGRASIWTLAATYKLVLKTSAGVTVWTQDGVPATNLSQSIVGVGGIVHAFGGMETSQVTAATYPTGTSYSACHADTSFWSLDSSLLVGTFALRGMMLTTTGGTLTVALVNLSDGSPNTPIATIASTSTTGEVVTSSAIPFAAAGTEKTYAIKAQISAGLGFSWGLEVVRTV